LKHEKRPGLCLDWGVLLFYQHCLLPSTRLNGHFLRTSFERLAQCINVLERWCKVVQTTIGEFHRMCEKEGATWGKDEEA